MFAICIESSHQRGMGHLFRALNLADLLRMEGEPYIVLINNNMEALQILEEKNVAHEVVDLKDTESNWESKLVKKYGVDVWINDRLDTGIAHARNVAGNNIKLVTFDDRGDGAGIADINFAGLAFEDTGELKGKKVFTGIRYLILSKEIERYKRIRKNADKILVTLGGSDTYGVTLKIAGILKALNKKASIVTGPSFKHRRELEGMIDENFTLMDHVPSLIKEFYQYDMAVTGGGITPFEANASGLPCIIIANELHEIQNGRYLERLGSSVFAGYYENIDTSCFKRNLNIEEMSKSGIKEIKTNGIENIYNELKGLRK